MTWLAEAIMLTVALTAAFMAGCGVIVAMADEGAALPKLHRPLPFAKFAAGVAVAAAVAAVLV